MKFVFAVFSQAIKQLLSNFQSQQSSKYNTLYGLSMNLVAHKELFFILKIIQSRSNCKFDLCKLIHCSNCNTCRSNAGIQGFWTISLHFVDISGIQMEYSCAYYG